MRDDAGVSAVPNGTVAQLTIGGSNTFFYHVEYKGRNLLVNGVVRQDGRNSAAASCLVWGTVQEIAPNRGDEPPGACPLLRAPGVV